MDDDLILFDRYMLIWQTVMCHCITINYGQAREIWACAERIMGISRFTALEGWESL